MHDEFGDHGFTVVSIALDQSADDARPYLKAAQATHPALIDTEHRVADLYRVVNVPTGIWIDAQGRIVRPNDAVFGNDTFVAMHGIESGPHLEALRAWARDGKLPYDEQGIRQRQTLPTAKEQLARAEFTLAWYLHRTGKREAAEHHFVRAGALAPLDFTIRRGSMPIRGPDPMGADFVELYQEWTKAGMPYYHKLG